MKFYDFEKEYQIPEQSDWRFQCWLRREKKKGIVNLSVTCVPRNSNKHYNKGKALAEMLMIMAQDDQGQTRDYYDY